MDAETQNYETQNGRRFSSFKKKLHAKKIARLTAIMILSEQFTDLRYSGAVKDWLLNLKVLYLPKKL